MSGFKSVPRQFVDDFETVTKFYRLLELGEYELAKAAARADLDAAITTYAVLALEIYELRQIRRNPPSNP